MRDHQPVLISEFNGLWKRGSQDNVPQDHFAECNNIDYSPGDFETRSGIDTYLPYPNVIRIYNYRKSESESLLILDSDGNIYDSAFPFVVILHITGMLDFGLEIINGRAYISPNTTVHGMQDEFVYVYLGEGVPARKAAGNPPVDADGALAAANSATAGHVEPGFRIYAVVYETDTGYDTAPGPDTLPTLSSPGGKKVSLSNIPVSPSSAVTKRLVVATKAISGVYTGDSRGYQFFFVPDGTIDDNTTTILDISFFDSDLIDDASHLIDNYSEIPAGVFLSSYGSRLMVGTLNEQQSTVLVSYPSEPEAISQIDGLIEVARDNLPLTIGEELRSVFYMFKNTRTFAVTDNGDVPSSWRVELIDAGLGASFHGVAAILEGGSNIVDCFIITNQSGIFLFTGTFQYPQELSYKIATFWQDLEVSSFQRIEIYNDPIRKYLYIILPDLEQLLIANYQEGLDYKSVKWGIWTFDVQITTICLTNFNDLIIGSRERL